jgi:drug/metabolite transporter (DMT)-like permease
MDPFVAALVLVSAVMHALWNALIKMGEDRLMSMAVIMGGTTLLAPVLLLFGPPPAPESWKFIGLSVLLNNAYFFFLIEAYRRGDLSHAYPLARGSAPILVAAGSVLFAGEHLTGTELTGVVIVSVGIGSLVAASGFRLQGGWRAIFYPLATGAMIASYTVSDAIGVRLSGSPLPYIGWMLMLFAIPIVTVTVILRRGRMAPFLRARWKVGAAAVLLNFGSYGIAIFALSLGAMAPVSALRETSVIFAALIGALVLKEPFGRARIVAACTVAAGVVVMNLGR